MELTFGLQLILGILGSSLVTSILTSILNNWWTDRRLRDQWEREKGERLEQWRREQEARRRQWKRQYREELLRPFLEKVNRLMGTAFRLQSRDALRASGQAKKMITQLLELGDDILSTTPVGVDDLLIPQLAAKFVHAFDRFAQAARGGTNEADMKNYWAQLVGAASELNKRAEELLEETFD
jgi:hypothetical protein